MIAIKPSAEIISGNDYRQMLEKIERIGRVCYKSENAIHPGSAERFIQNIITRGHESVIEQESTRYCNYTQDRFGSQLLCIDIATGFRYDLDDPADRKKYELWTAAMESAERFYFQLIEAGARPEEARSVLPNSLKTEIVMTMNLREWRHFFRLRTSRRAHPQIAEIASALLGEFASRYPVFFGDLLGPAE